MDYSDIIINLYNQVFEREKQKFGVDGNRIRAAIQIMKETYLPNKGWQNDLHNTTANFNDPACRCAYIHKYAMIHTGLLCEILQRIFQNSNIQRQLASKSALNLCSLGGGPGTDIVSLLLVIQQIFGKIKCNADIIDFAQEWKKVFESIISELKTGQYGQVSSMVSYWNFTYEYLRADLLSMSYYEKFQVLQSVKNADIITMIKFISAAACDKTKIMVKKIFENMKLGALLVFVDNAAGGFDKMLRQAALEYGGMQTVFGPLQHYDYENSRFSLKKLGYMSQSKTKVTIEVWKKVTQPAYNTTAQLRREYMQGPAGRYTGESSNTVRLTPEEESEGCCSII